MIEKDPAHSRVPDPGPGQGLIRDEALEAGVERAGADLTAEAKVEATDEVDLDPSQNRAIDRRIGGPEVAKGQPEVAIPENVVPVRVPALVLNRHLLAVPNLPPPVVEINQTAQTTALALCIHHQRKTQSAGLVLARLVRQSPWTRQRSFRRIETGEAVRGLNRGLYRKRIQRKGGRGPSRSRQRSRGI